MSHGAAYVARSGAHGEVECRVSRPRFDRSWFLEVGSGLGPKNAERRPPRPPAPPAHHAPLAPRTTATHHGDMARLRLRERGGVWVAVAASGPGPAHGGRPPSRTSGRGGGATSRATNKPSPAPRTSHYSHTSNRVLFYALCLCPPASFLFAFRSRHRGGRGAPAAYFRAIYRAARRETASQKRGAARAASR
jgi:hypothetical protein